MSNIAGTETSNSCMINLADLRLKCDRALISTTSLRRERDAIEVGTGSTEDTNVRVEISVGRARGYGENLTSTLKCVPESLGFSVGFSITSHYCAIASA